MWLNLWRVKGGQEGIEKCERKLPCMFFYFNLDNREAESNNQFGGYLGTYMHNICMQAHIQPHTLTHTHMH